MFVIGSTIIKIRGNVLYWKTTKKGKIFDEVARKTNIACTKELILDCATR